PDTLAPLAAQPFAGATTVATDAGGPAIAIAAHGSRGRLCAVVPKTAVTWCMALPFAPTGVGAAAARVAVADGRAGAGALFARRGTRLVRSGGAIAVGKEPHGVMSFFRGSFYVPIQRGIAVIAVATRRVQRIPLPVTPSALWLVPFEGRLFAALPGTGQV